MTEPVLRMHRCGDLRFYILSLHPEAEARDLEVSGAAPVGSLVEWIDDIFETPVTPIDRTLGKWQNVVYAESYWDPAFWSEVYSVKDGTCMSQRLYEIVHARYGEPSE